MTIKDKYQNWKDKPKVWKTRYTIIIVLLILFIGCGITYTYFTQHGKLFQEDFSNAFNTPQEIKEVEVYSNGTLIHEYIGYYSVQSYNGHYVILDHSQQKRIDVWGDVVVVADNPVVTYSE